MVFSADDKVLINSVADWYKFLIQTLSSALKTMFTQRSRDASKSDVSEKVIPAADF